MPSNAHALIRYRTIDRCLKSKNKDYFLPDLMEECSMAVTEYEEFRKNKSVPAMKISRRTILYDLKFMKDDKVGFNAPIIHDKSEGYQYDDEHYEIFRAKISTSDLDRLNEAMLILKDLSGISQYKELESLATRLEETYNIKRKIKDHSPIQFDSSTNIQGQQWLSEIKKYMSSQTVLTINYKPFGKTAYLRYISPYLIREYNNRWFLIGWDHDNERITNVGMDRILSLNESIREWHDESTFDPKKYTDDIVGVSIPAHGKITKVKIKAHGLQRFYLDTKRWHKTMEKIKEGIDYYIFELKVIPNFELESKIMANVDNLEVISPKSLRNRIHSRLENGMENFYKTKK